MTFKKIASEQKFELQHSQYTLMSPWPTADEQGKVKVRLSVVQQQRVTLQPLCPGLSLWMIYLKDCP